MVINVGELSWVVIADAVGLGFICIGSIFTLISAIGMLRYPDLLSRQHVATKPQVLSLILFLLGVILMVRQSSITWTLLVVIAFQLISSPISAHMLSRAGYRTGRVVSDDMVVDELREDMGGGIMWSEDDGGRGDVASSAVSDAEAGAREPE
ncbi:monovalent cation/H(+) antiporter subunit G [Arcanobacterium ihumii]|uniref:monovalent cation/H(+) antiporter subunit G n=1 Tax=Arcanobacterium ihumii TaxID=2138162 RepID=UPI001F360330|nr:monovalent cation/H(+) antiporter subunit G [Arcanobacterium ihumii]